MKQFGHVRLEIDGARAQLILNRPESRNGMTGRMVRETHEALTFVAREESVRVLVLKGEGASFCPGADLNSVGKPTDDPEEYADAIHFQVPVLLHNMAAVTVAAVAGPCAGAGFGWACGCDIRVANESAMFNTAFLNVAVAGDMGLPWSLPRLVGGAKARELSFFTQKFDVSEAQRIGLVARVYSDEKFDEEVDILVTELLERSPTALKFMKAHYVAAESMPMESYVALETERHRDIASGEHAREAFSAFVEKRKPNFD